MRCGMTMKAAFAMMVGVLAVVQPAAAQWHQRDQDDVYRDRREGAVKSLRAIEGGVVPRMKARGADYIGAEYDQPSGRYRLKFVRDGAVIWVDVDARSGNIVARAGD
jgi:uncharacterized membrane protein YkoI